MIRGFSHPLFGTTGRSGLSAGDYSNPTLIFLNQSILVNSYLLPMEPIFVTGGVHNTPPRTGFGRIFQPLRQLRWTPIVRQPEPLVKV
jgi:hypothetical protein